MVLALSVTILFTCFYLKGKVCQICKMNLLNVFFWLFVSVICVMLVIHITANMQLSRLRQGSCWTFLCDMKRATLEPRKAEAGPGEWAESKCQPVLESWRKIILERIWLTFARRSLPYVFKFTSFLRFTCGSHDWHLIKGLHFLGVLESALKVVMWSLMAHSQGAVSCYFPEVLKTKQ